MKSICGFLITLLIAPFALIGLCAACLVGGFLAGFRIYQMFLEWVGSDD